MKRTAYIFAMLIALTACQEELIQDISSDGFVGTIEDFADQTRTSLAEGNYIAWSEGDRIAVFQGGADPDCFEVADASAGKTRASFEAVSTSGNDGQNQKYSENIAIYPYSSASSCLTDKVSGGKVLSYTVKPVNYPSIQSYKEDSFPTDALVMAAVTESLSDRDLHFKAASAVLRFKVKGTTSLQSIKVTGNSDEPLSGNASVGVNTDGSSPIVSMTNSPSSVTLDCGKGVALDESEATVFMLCIPPTDFAEGFTVTFTDTEGVEDVRTVSKSLSVKQGHIFGMSEITFGQQSGSSGEYDYVDEYGINHGQGVEIDGVVWAPVNCGYHETDFKYGKLYQWGRKYGQGYSGELYDINGNKTGTYTDAAVPTVQSGPVSLSEGQSEDSSNILFKGDNWLPSPFSDLWNIGTEDNPTKTEYDPCPDGWRVPTLPELGRLISNKSSRTMDSKGLVGYWFSGSIPYSSSVPQMFLSASGYQNYFSYGRGLAGFYWSSRSDADNGYVLDMQVNYCWTGYYSIANGSSVRCVQDDGELVPVTSVSLNKSSVTIDEGDTYTLSASISPSNANHQSAHWWSDDESIATVDQTGKVTAVSAGTATITAMAGMKTATCTVTVKDQSVAQEGDYIDEYGVNHGPGVEIDGVVWAPVNCGYHETDFKYGKLYQWGRKYGQGYSGASYDVSGNYVGTISDSSVPSVVDAVVSLAEAQSQDNEGIFYKAATSMSDVIYPSGIPLWNIGNETFPKKTEYDPCPEGWRVPTLAELTNLKAHKSSWTDSQGFNGLWFSGKTSYSSTAPRVFLCAAGFHEYRRQEAESRGLDGRYWSSKSSSSYAYRLNFDHNGNNVLTTSNSRVNGYSVRCVKDDGELVPVSSVTLDKSSVTMDEGDTYTLSASISPSDANHQSAHWWSDDESIATVDQTGKVTAVSAGTATITAMAGMKTATCTVTVKGQTVAQEGDYIDEYGINHGQGVEIDGVVWAPVNCGYHKDDYEYGKLYQWGRKYGQGYDGYLYDINGNYTGTYTDATVPTEKSGPVSMSTGQSKSNEDYFYKSSYPYDWLSSPDDELWNSGTESDPVKTEYDPCPEGWRVPTYEELDELNDNRSSWTTDENVQIGYWFSGSKSYSSSVPRIFFPAAGYRDSTSDASDRGRYGIYWSSRPNVNDAYYLGFTSSLTNMYNNYRAYGFSVRCVQVID